MKMNTLPGALMAAFMTICAGSATAESDSYSNGLNMTKARLIPRYPADLSCSPLTSFYASWDDVDGAKRSEPHSGVDGGRLGDEILAPAAGEVIAAWETNWGWGREGALLIRHAREDLGLQEGPKYFYSEFDHLRYQEVRSFKKGQKIARGQSLVSVYRPGGKSRYLPEVHWEVWGVEVDTATTWSQNEFGGRFWANKTAHLVDPLYMLSLDAPPNDDGSVDIPVYDSEKDYSKFRGFTYILPCDEKDDDVPTATGRGK
jgi:murein DD-endopeptidase MepM/ murein hydrolase activator NlpD